MSTTDQGLSKAKFTVTSYPEGTFSWIDATSRDAAASKKFYMEVMKWDVEDIPIGDDRYYHMFSIEGLDIAGLSQMRPEDPQIWSSYIAVDNVDSMVDKVKTAGGTVVMDPMDVFNAGRMLVIQDPTGAYVTLWQAKERLGAQLVNHPGSLTWNELHTAGDVETAKAFFNALLGWEYQQVEGSDYWLILNKGRMNGGIMQGTDNMPSYWLVYLAVENLAETLQAVEANGGKVLKDLGNTGSGDVAIIEDPGGAVCALIQSKNPDPWVE